MKFGIFDHLDNIDLPLSRFFAERLRIIELYERLGFHCYHVAEHHGTSLGMAPSPNLFLAAVAERTTRLRFGPMVYAVPLYHPLRLVQEIIMLDHLSEGRLDVGFGRGSSPVEMRFFGIDPSEAEVIFQNAVPRILDALKTGVFDAAHQQAPFDNIQLAVRSYQQPMPRVWYGVHSPPSAERAARRGWQTINLDSAEEAFECNKAYRQAAEPSDHASDHLLGLGRFIVVADTDSEAQTIAHRAYPLWHKSFTHLGRTLGSTARHPRPSSWDELHRQGKGVAGTPERVAEFCLEQMRISQCNYLVGQFAFGDQTIDELNTSITLFGQEVMPKLMRALSL
jgi:alkanesulfonate monooxygenase SsuD/methylene tetrahydromethanopterin reductase-like flavin-dependent oxidoreductase (luciferase family)